MSETDILVTAFMPFGGDSMNPTEAILVRLPAKIRGARLFKLLLPVEFKAAPEILLDGMRRISPAAVIMLGQAGGRSAVTPELFGRNVMEARIPDNAGFSPHGEPVAEGGAESLSSTLPNERIVGAIRALGLPAELSESAGTYVCNTLLYSALSAAGGSLPVGFIHIPFAREQTEGVTGREQTPFMELSDMERAVIAAIEAVAQTLEAE